MLTFSQLLLAVSIPTIVALVGVVLNQSAISGLRGEIGGLRGEIGGLRGEIAALRKELYDQVTALLKEIHKVDVRVVGLEEREKK